MEELKQTTDIPFVNEIVMNEYTLREIMLDLWTYKATRNRLPLIIYLAAVIIPMIYAFISGKNEFMLLAAIILLCGMGLLLVYLGAKAYIGAKKREKVIQQTLEKYGPEAVLTIHIDEKNIRYSFDQAEKIIDYHDIEKVIELNTYLILQLKNHITLPIWKPEFTKGKWDDFIPFFKQKLKLTGK